MRIYQTKDYLTIKADVPCDTAIECWLNMHRVNLDRLVSHSRHYEQAYLAWETVRYARNPYFMQGTGFEGYFVGVVHSPEAVWERLLAIGRSMLLSNWRLYRFDYGFRARLMRALTADQTDPETMGVWSSLLGAALARLRINLYTNPNADYFHSETYQLVRYLPPIHYATYDHCISQEYTILPGRENHGPRPTLDLNTLKGEDYDAGLVVMAVGRFGHPLIREYLRLASLRDGEGY
ncbi:MAG: hypothetical protein K8I30_21665 [Anaerolineae bacterium]|nr:hypothetical protein [Anaerolineae bacterium]